jgi:uncharacterized protein YlxW (UPF0749 family)
VVQVRSQAEVEKTLVHQDSASLAFTIDDLHRSNDSLAEQVRALGSRRDHLRSAEGSDDADVRAEADRLRAIEGVAPVHGPGIVLKIDAPLTPLDLQDEMNNLRTAGAEAIALNDVRIVTGSAITVRAGVLEVDGINVQRPWTLQAIGDPARLPAAAEAMTQSLRADRRVRAISYSFDNDLTIRAVLRQRPFVYGTS